MSMINLLPEEYVKMQAQRRVNILCLSLFAVVIAGVAGAHHVTSRSFDHTCDVRDRINDRYTRATELIQQMTELEARKRSMLKKAETTSRLVERIPRSTLLAVVTNARPEGMSILEINLVTLMVKPRKALKSGVNKTGKAVLSRKSRKQAVGKSVVKVEMSVTGTAPSDDKVGEYVYALKNNPLIASADLEYTREELFDDVPLRQFRIRLSLNKDIDAINVVNPTEDTTAPVATRDPETSDGGNS